MIDSKIQPYGCYVECNAENKCIQGEFNSRDYYCKEYKGFNEMSDYEKDKYKQKVLEDKAKKDYKEYCFRYFPKEQAKKMYKDKYQTKKG